MKVQTSRFGELDISEESLIVFPAGLVGFPHLTKYAVFDTEKDSGYQWLQSVEDATLAVVIVQLAFVKPDLRITVPDEAVAELEISEDDPVSVSVIVTIPQGRPENATVNLRAPILVNLRTRRAKQLVLHESLPLQYPLIPDNGANVEDRKACAEVSTPVS